MDDSCAVCAENLEWVAYGACGHRDVCSTCVSRLRFICDDRRCCICKTESNVIFVTKALGDYTKMINDFSVLPTEVREARVGPYWYHEDTQSFFDDADHYRMIKAMCKLSCSECDKMEEQSNDRAMPTRRGKFRNIEQLKGHLFHQHRLLMCSLCLEGRKVFICEQKLYTRAQLNQHINTGDSEVDGTESERGGFMGHPICEFCKTPFYGENELYSHMSTEHYTCHICQRQHPGQHDYYKNYDDLEIHFRRDHYLCEDEACLAKKFIVFQSEAEIKRHNAVEHGGRMSRAQRNAALQIPTSFRYRRRNDDNRRGRERTSDREPSDNDYHLSLAIEASLETASDPPTSSTTHVVSDRGDINDIDSLVQPFESLSATDSESSYRYRQALGGGSLGAPLQGTSFPPLSTPSSTSQQAPVNTMAAHLRHQKNKFNRNTNASSSAQEWPARSRGSVQVARSSSQVRPMTNVAAASSVGNSNGFPQLRNASSATNAAAASSLGNSNGFPQLRNAGSATNATAASSLGNSNGFPKLSSASSRQVRPVTNVAAASSFGNSNGFPQLSNAGSSHSQMQVQSHPTTAADILKASGSRMSAGNTSRISHSSSAPDLTNDGFSKHSVADFPPVSSAQRDKQSSRSQVITNVKDVQSANKSLVEKMQAALDYDEEKYTAFKEISGQYHRGVIGTSRYFDYAQQYGLSHLVLELARLCPDLQKQKELIDTYNASLQSNVLQVNGEAQGSDLSKDNNASKKWKGKSVDTAGSDSKDAMADSIMTSVHKLQSSYKPSEEVEVLSKDDYRPVKGNSRLMVNEQLEELKSTSKPLINIGGKNDSVSANVGPKDGVGGSKQRKKTSKFHRVRLGDGSMGALLDLKHSDLDPDPAEAVNNNLDSSEKSSGALPVRGVWKKGGGKKLFS